MNNFNIIGVLVVLCLLTLNLNGQITSSNSLVKTGTVVKIGKLPNGFTYYLQKNESKGISLRFLIKAGYDAEEADQKGLAHLLEHLPFQKTKNFEGAKAYFDKLGVEINASTGNHTQYDIDLESSKDSLIDTSIKFFRDVANNILLDPKTIDRERGIVLEEFRLGLVDDENFKIERLRLNYIMGDTRFAKQQQIDEVQNIRFFKHSSLKNFYEKWYKANFQALIVVGNFDEKKVEQIIKSQFSDLQTSNISLENYHSVDTSFFAWKNQFLKFSENWLKSDRIEIVIKRKEKYIDDIDYLKFLIKTKLYNSVLLSRSKQSSEINKSVRIPYPYYKHNIVDHGPKFDAILSSYKFEDSVAPKSVLKSMFLEIERVKRHGFSREELATAKKSLVNDSYLFPKKNNSYYVGEIINNFVLGRVLLDQQSREQLISNVIRAISVEDLNKDLKRWFDINNNLDVFQFSKQDSNSQNLSEKEVWEILREVKGSRIEPYSYINKKKNIAKILMSAADTKQLKSIKFNATFDKETGSKTIQLPNGIEVILKKLQQGETNGEMVLKSSRTFESNLQQKALEEYVPGIIVKSGLSSMNDKELQDFYKANGINWVSPYIADEIGFVSNFKSEALEKILQSIYLYSTNPKIDSTEFQNGIKNAIDKLKARRTFQEIYSDTINCLIYGLHRNNKNSIDQLQKIGTENALNYFRQMFSVTHGARFVIVGDFQDKEVEQLVTKYLGNIPARDYVSKSPSIYRYFPSNLPPSIITDSGENERSEVSLYLLAPADYTVLDNLKSKLIRQYLDAKLFERLRSQEGGVYGVFTEFSLISKYPSGSLLRVNFICSRSNINKLISASLEEIERIKADGISLTDLNQVKKIMAAEVEGQLSKGSFWKEYLSSHKGRTLNRQFLSGPAEINMLEEITSADIKAFAIKCLDTTKTISFIMASSDRPKKQ